METFTESPAMQAYWIANFFTVLSREPELYRDCMISRIRAMGEKATLSNPDNFREFICCWIFVHCFILHEHVVTIEDSQLRGSVQQLALGEIARVCHNDDAISQVLVEFFEELESKKELTDPGFSFSPGHMLAWYYCKRLQIMFQLKHHEAGPTDLPSRAELALITCLTDDTIPMTLSSFDHLLEPRVNSEATATFPHPA